MLSQSPVSSIIQDQAKDPLFTTEEAAEYIGVSIDTMAVWRCVKRYDLSYIKVGRLVKYRKSALDLFLNNRTHSTEV